MAVALLRFWLAGYSDGGHGPRHLGMLAELLRLVMRGLLLAGRPRVTIAVAQSALPITGRKGDEAPGTPRCPGRQSRGVFGCCVALAFLGPAVTIGAQGILINELQSSNGGTLVDEDGDYPDWIELWNRGPVALDLDGYGLSDRFGSPFKWVFSGSTVLAPGEFLVVHASGKDRQPLLPSPLAPTALADLRVWLQAAAVIPADPGQVRSTADGHYLRKWMDLSGTHQDAVQTVEHRQPRWIASGSAGSPVVRFDGMDDLLQLPRPAATNDFTLFVVCSTSEAHESDTESRSGVGGVSGQRWLFGAQHGGDLDAGVGVSIGTNGLSVYEHGSGYMPALLAYRRPLSDGTQLLAVTYTAQEPSLDLEGLQVRTGLKSSRRQVWAPVEIGAGAYGAFGGDILEVLIFGRALSPDERRGIARHLAEHYALPLPLPKHTNFKLDAAGEQLALTRSDGLRVDQVSFGAIPRDVSYGRSAQDPSVWAYYARPTPGAPNPNEGATEWLSAPGFSHAGGFYPSAFELVLTHPDPAVEIRYTLNGDEPTAQSSLYGQPLSLRSRAGTPNQLSAIPTAPGWQPPAREVFKGWPVRARAFKPGALSSRVVSRTFWVDALGSGRYSLPVIALTTAPAHFFDPDIGIYVAGNAPGANYSQRGPEWQRPVHVEFYESDGRLVFAQNGDVKIHGNTSQGFPIKGLDLDGTGGEGEEPFRHRFFPNRNRDEFEHVLLRPSGHDHHLAFMRDELMQALGSETGAENQAARPCVVFLNGEYWGLHYLKEKQDAEYVAYYGGVDPEAMDYLEGYAAARVGDTVHYDAMLHLLTTDDPAHPETYARIEAFMDVANYIDYKVCEIFNYRWDIGNHRLWRPRKPEGKWRWLQFDNDVGWGGFWAEAPGWHYNMLEAVLTPDGRLHGHNGEATTFLLRRLLLSNIFRGAFLNRFADLLNTTLESANTLAQVDRHAAPLIPEMAEHIQRWRAPASLSAWHSQVDFLREYARRRPDVCRQQLVEYFSLPGTARLTLEVEPRGKGTLTLNTLDPIPLPTSDGLAWQGIYFRGTPVRLIARPQAGYVLAGWNGLPGVTTNDVRLLLQGDHSIVARFEPVQPAPPRLTARLSDEGELVLSVTAEPDSSWVVETSSDLKRWLSGQILVTDGHGRAEITIPTTTSNHRYLRAAPP